MTKKKKKEKGYSPWSSASRTYKSFGVDKEQLKARQEERTKKVRALVVELGRLYPYLHETIIGAVVFQGLTLDGVKTLKRLNARARDVYNGK